MANEPPGRVSGPVLQAPKPTIWPLVLALGLAILAVGVATSPGFVAVGALFFLAGLAGWVSELMPGRGHVREPAAGARPAEVVGRPGAVETLKPGMAGYRFRLPEKVHPISAGLRGGLAGGLVMPLPALVWGVLSGHGVWFPANLLAGMLLPGVDRMSVGELEQFHPGLLLIAAVIHATFSAIVGLLYGVLLPTLPGRPARQVLAGGVVIPLIWTGMSYGLMGVANPLLARYVDWHWFALSQFVFGVTAAAVVVRCERVTIPPAGPGPGAAPSTLSLLLSVALFAPGCVPPGRPSPQESTPSRPTARFDTLYAKHCAGCHGDDGNLGPGPPLNDPLFLRIVPEEELRKVIAEGRPGTPMPAFHQAEGGSLSGEEVKIMAEGIRRRWGTNTSAPHGIPGYSSRDPGKGARPESVRRGQLVFNRACAGCHGADGGGGEFAGEPVGGINDPAFLELSSNQVLRRYVITGRPDLGMPDYAGTDGRPAEFAPLTAAEVDDLVALLASWRASGRSGSKRGGE